jgi:hypothetical protein
MPAQGSPAPKVAPTINQDVIQVAPKIVGGTNYGRYPKISVEQTWNFIISDGFLVPYAGYKNVLTLSEALPGRGIYSSYRGDIMIAAIGSIVYSIAPNLAATVIGNLFTNTGDVFIAENNGGQICLTDGVYVYVYNYAVPTTPLLLSSNPATPNYFVFPFPNPGYISFQNGRLIIACMDTFNWVLSGFNMATVWTNDAQHVGELQTKPDYVQATVPVPGGGNNLLVFGRNVTELWQDVGAALFPYQRNSTFNVDYGCLNPATVAHLKNFTVWLAVNEQSGPVLMVYIGNDIQPISTDGIDFTLGNLTNPENCTGFLYQQDGHVIYQFTFPDDNISYAYDFETKLFFNVSDENLNYHIAREIVYFNNTYYFVSLNGGNIYEFDTLFTDAEYAPDNIKQIPRIRITPPLRLPDQRYFIIKSLGFTIENGQPNIITTVVVPSPQGTPIATESGIQIATESGSIIDTEGENLIPAAVYTYSASSVSLAISRDGGENFGSFWKLDMNATGQRKSRFIYQRLGQANDCTFQLRFNGFGRFICTEGQVEVYK